MPTTIFSVIKIYIYIILIYNMKFEFFNKIREIPRLTKIVWALIILFFVGILIAYLTGYLNQVAVIGGNISFIILGVLLFVLVVAVLLGILGIKLKN